METGGQSGIQAVQSFFDMKSQTAGIENAMGITSPFITFTIWVIQVLGFVAIGIWFLRIAVDVIALATKNLEFAEKIQKFGTGKKESYESTMAYIKGNGVEIVLVITLTVLMMTGLLFRILSLALGGIGTILNVVFNLDLDGLNSAADAAAFVENLETRKPASLRNEYDKHLSSAKGYADQLYAYAADGLSKNDPDYQAVSRKYTTALAKAELISKTDVIKNFGKQLKLGDAYFEQHKYNADVCNKKFVDTDTLTIWSGQSSTLSIRCQ